jgi:hypothetical protein
MFRGSAMRLLTFLLAWLFLALPLQARAQQGPVVVELFTSQGCAACPPADALLALLAEREDVIALSLYVDYWDYLGWTDSFGNAAFTARQRAYAKSRHSRSIFTPQMIVQGQDVLIGHDVESITDRIAARLNAGSPVEVTARREGGALRIRLDPLEPVAGLAEVSVVEYMPSAQVVISAGENAGKHMRYTNIVTDWSTVGRWAGQPDEFVVPAVGEGPLAVVVQRVGFGPILGAAQLD